MTLTALIDEIERATEGSAALDDKIASAVLTFEQTVRLKGSPDDDPGFAAYRYPDGSIGSALRYSRSLDAARTLVPEGWNWYLMGPDAFKINPCVALLGLPGQREAKGEARTHALALCAAALRARKEMDNG